MAWLVTSETVQRDPLEKAVGSSQKQLLEVSFYQGNSLMTVFIEHSIGVYPCAGTWKTAPRSIKPSLVFLPLLVRMGWVLSRNKEDKLYVCLQNEEGWRRAVWEKNMKMIELHNREYSQRKHGFTMAMNAFGDMVSVEWVA